MKMMNKIAKMGLGGLVADTIGGKQTAQTYKMLWRNIGPMAKSSMRAGFNKSIKGKGLGIKGTAEAIRKLRVSSMKLAGKKTYQQFRGATLPPKEGFAGVKGPGGKMIGAISAGDAGMTRLRRGGAVALGAWGAANIVRPGDNIGPF